MTGRARPWGRFWTLLSIPWLWVKVIRVDDGHRTSLQWHARRWELWLPLSGNGMVEVGARWWRQAFGWPIFVRKAVWHRLSGPLWLLEVAGGRPEESDIHRLDDDYGRD